MLQRKSKRRALAPYHFTMVEAYEHVRRGLEGMGLRTWYTAAEVPGARGDGVRVSVPGTVCGGLGWVLEREARWYVMKGSPVRGRISEVGAGVDLVELFGVFHEVFSRTGALTGEEWVAVVERFGLKTVSWPQWMEEEEARWERVQGRRGWKALRGEEEQNFYRWFNSTNWLTNLGQGTSVYEVDLSDVVRGVKWPGEKFDELELRLEGELREVLRDAVGREGELVAVDVNHSAWRFRPWEVRLDWGETWPVMVMPGEWVAFVEKDYSGGVVGNPETAKLCAFGERFVGAMRGRDWETVCREWLR